MKIFLAHGYFLKGTGSNLFVKNVCRELCLMGHDVLLFCQEDDTEDIDFIENTFDFNMENTAYNLSSKKKTHYVGKCSLYRPNLNGFLPVYVYDKYKGYSVKEFTSCTQEEIEEYIECNVNAINSATNGLDIDLVWTNHSIMQPVYVARSNLGKSNSKRVMTGHGSCLNFSVRKSELLKRYALEGIVNNDKIVFLSEFSRDEFLDFFKEDDIKMENSIVIAAGADLEKFNPIKNSNEKNNIMKEFITTLEHSSESQLVINNQSQEESDWKTDIDVVSKLKQIDFEKEQVILYYGKYLWTKGIHLIIAAAPMIIKKHPNARFVFVGYGSNREYFEAIIEALDNNKREDYINLIKHPDKFNFEIEKEASIFFNSLLKQLEDHEFSEEYFLEAKNVIKSKIVFTGYLNHDQLKNLIACSEMTVAPSIFPEAFGLVAVEALATGVIPLQTNHSGFSEVIEKYVEEFPEIFDNKEFKQLNLNEDLVLNLANSIIFMLDYYKSMKEQDKKRIRERARKIANDNYSWSVMVRKYLTI